MSGWGEVAALARLVALAAAWLAIYAHHRRCNDPTCWHGKHEDDDDREALE